MGQIGLCSYGEAHSCTISWPARIQTSEERKQENREEKNTTKFVSKFASDPFLFRKPGVQNELEGDTAVYRERFSNDRSRWDLDRFLAWQPLSSQSEVCAPAPFG